MMNTLSRWYDSDVAHSFRSSPVAILAALMRSPDRVFSRPQLTDAIWGAGSPISDRTLDSHLRNLRRKLAEAGLPDPIRSLHGIGIGMAPADPHT